MKRTAQINRSTKETTISLSLSLEGTGAVKAATGVGFLDHMLDHLGKHSLCDLDVKAVGDVQVDDHHTVEDVGICLGQALAKALGDKAGIRRYGQAVVPMDEALAEVALDISGRSMLVFNVAFPGDKIGTFDTQLVGEFLQAFCREGGLNLHVNVRHGSNDHHIAEAIFKALAQAMRSAISIDPARNGQMPSTKGTL